MSSLRVLDLGAGNGIVGEELRRAGASSVLGLDLFEEAAEATRRDRPGVYEDYIVGDVTALGGAERSRLERFGPTALTCVAALGYGDIPPAAFAAAFNAVEAGGWVALTIKDRFLDESDDSGFSRLMRAMLREGIVADADQTTYQHRLSMAGRPLMYVALAGRKTRDIPAGLVADGGSA